MFGILRIKNQRPAIERGIVTQSFLNLGNVIANAVGAPKVRNSVIVVRVVFGGLVQDHLVQIAKVFQFGFVDFLEDACLDQALCIGQSRNDKVITRIASQQFGFDNLVAVIDVVIDLYAIFLFEIGDGFFADIVRLVINVKDFLCRCACAKARKGSVKDNQPGRLKKLFHLPYPHHCHRFYTCRS